MSSVDDQSVNNNPNITNEMDFINKDHERTNSAPFTDFTFPIIKEPSNNDPSTPLKNISRENWNDFNTQSPKLEEKQIYLDDLTMKDQNMLQTVDKECTTTATTITTTAAAPISHDKKEENFIDDNNNNNTHNNNNYYYNNNNYNNLNNHNNNHNIHNIHNKGSREIIEDESMQEDNNPDGVLGGGVVETPPSLLQKENDNIPNHQLEMHNMNMSISSDNNNNNNNNNNNDMVSRSSFSSKFEKSIDQSPTIITTTDLPKNSPLESLSSSSYSGLNVQNGVIQNNNTNTNIMDTDETFNIQYNQDRDNIQYNIQGNQGQDNNNQEYDAIHARSTNLFVLPKNENVDQGNQLSVDQGNRLNVLNVDNNSQQISQISQISQIPPQIPQISNIEQTSWGAPPNLDDNNNNAEHNYGRENRRWRGRRSQSSHTDNNDKSESKGHLNLRKLSDAEFQALPSGSRLFLGNLSTHSTSKKELYDIFSPHGEILQISIKNSFGFVQYDNPASVIRAIEKENGRALHGLKLGLEVSHGKPWHHSSSHEGGFKPSGGNRQGKHWNKKVYKDSWHQNDRDYPPSRGSGGGGGVNHGQSYQDRRYDEYDRRPNDYNNRRASYDSRGSYDHSDQRSSYRNNNNKEENEYNNIGSGNRPSPRDDRKYRRNSYREDHHDERYPHRSKPYRIPSREFVERRQSRDHQYRSQSHDEHDDEFPLPRRQGSDVPECQIIVLEEAERNFIWQVESAFRDASISVHTLHLSRKLHIQAVIRQMIVEGVHAVVFMERHLALNGRVNMQIFDQTRLRDNVKYDEYNNIKVEEAVGLLLRTRITQRPSDFRSPDNLLFGGQPNISQTQQTHSIGGQPAPAGLNSISLSNVNFAALANLLGTLQQPAAAAAANPAPNVQPMSIITPGNMQTSQPGSLTQQQPNFDVQQLLRQLSPQNAGIPNPPFITVPSQITSNLGPPPSTFNTSIVGQPTNTITPNSLAPNVIPLTQHQPQHINPNMQQFQTPSNVTDIMSQFKQYSTQR